MAPTLRHAAAWIWPLVLVFGAILYRVNQDGSCRRRLDLGTATGAAPDRRVRPRSNLDPTPQAYVDWLLRRTQAWATETRQAELAPAVDAARRAFLRTDCDRTIPAARDLGRRLRAVTTWPRLPRRRGDPPFPATAAELIREVDGLARWLCPDYRPG